MDLSCYHVIVIITCIYCINYNKGKKITVHVTLIPTQAGFGQSRRERVKEKRWEDRPSYPVTLSHSEALPLLWQSKFGQFLSRSRRERVITGPTCIWSSHFLNHFPPKLTKTTPFVILLCLMQMILLIKGEPLSSKGLTGPIWPTDSKTGPILRIYVQYIYIQCIYILYIPFLPRPAKRKGLTVGYHHLCNDLHLCNKQSHCQFSLDWKLCVIIIYNLNPVHYFMSSWISFQEISFLVMSLSSTHWIHVAKLQLRQVNKIAKLQLSQVNIFNVYTFKLSKPV